MSVLNRLFGSDKQKSKKGKVYKSSDNLGTTYTSHNQVNSAWQVQGMMFEKGANVNLTIDYEDKTVNKGLVSKGHPFICYTYTNEEDAKQALSSISFIKIASDTNDFICLETLEFGCYETEINGVWEVIIWGENLTKEMQDESREKLAAAEGELKGERKAPDKPKTQPKASTKGGKTTHVRTYQQGANTYEIHKAPSKSVALEYLKKKTVTKGLYYVVVETPEGNWGKDKDGIYKE